ncbi:hypothetical protein FB45DRAFT_871335 [Roridomyces roridus]|uniref:Uncharacterized protein n=1 Tax=Roridomyces roridus TaxID=1738132 RepID=A0AAD7FHI5_9AGAR|nr:hypothetical protein FB45DRAFT_871335 [Roridomyces roridus]
MAVTNSLSVLYHHHHRLWPLKYGLKLENGANPSLRTPRFPSNLLEFLQITYSRNSALKSVPGGLRSGCIAPAYASDYLFSETYFPIQTHSAIYAFRDVRKSSILGLQSHAVMSSPLHYVDSNKLLPPQQKESLNVFVFSRWCLVPEGKSPQPGSPDGSPNINARRHTLCRCGSVNLPAPPSFAMFPNSNSNPRGTLLECGSGLAHHPSELSGESKFQYFSTELQLFRGLESHAVVASPLFVNALSICGIWKWLNGLSTCIPRRDRHNQVVAIASAPSDTDMLSGRGQWFLVSDSTWLDAAAKYTHTASDIPRRQWIKSRGRRGLSQRRVTEFIRAVGNLAILIACNRLIVVTRPGNVAGETCKQDSGSSTGQVFDGFLLIHLPQGYFLSSKSRHTQVFWRAFPNLIPADITSLIIDTARTWNFSAWDWQHIDEAESVESDLA